jgi:hypothetical protein
VTLSDAWLEPLTYAECVDRLRATRVGRIAVVTDGFPLILPVNFRLTQTSPRQWIAIRTRPGNVIDRAPIFAAFEIDDFDVPRREGWSVVVRGTLHHVDPIAADFAARFDPEPWLLDERDSWMVLEPSTVTGRRLHQGETEWAFHARAYL